MDDWRSEFSDRLLEFAAAVILLTDKLKTTYASHHIAKQLIRSATSMGANYGETCNAESRQDFVHKMQIVLKESQETLYWLQLLERAKLAETQAEELRRVLDEATAINKITAKSVITAKKGK